MRRAVIVFAVLLLGCETEAEKRAKVEELARQQLEAQRMAEKALFEAQKDCIIRLKQTGAISPSSLQLLHSRIDGEYLTLKRKLGSSVAQERIDSSIESNPNDPSSN